MTATTEEEKLKVPPVSMAVKVTVVLILVASFYCAEHPDSTLARFIRGFRHRKKNGQPS